MRDTGDTWLPQPDLAGIDVQTVLSALADPVRLLIVRELNDVGESTCTALNVPVKVSTVSHHLGVLRDCGIVSSRIDGNARPSRLRHDDLQRRFPGLLEAVINAAPPHGGGL